MPNTASQSPHPVLRILHLEDNATDAELMRALLESEGVNCTIKRIETREAFQTALEEEPFDLIISDFTLPSFDGVSALTFARQKKPELPFIFVSGTIGEEAAVQSLRHGATDYILKDRMSRLPASVRRVVQEALARTERRRAEEKIREQAALLDRARDAICVTDLEQRIFYWNKGAERLFGWSAPDIANKNANELLLRGNTRSALAALKELIRNDEWQGELQKFSKDGRENIVESRWTLLRDDSGLPKSILMIDTDVTEKRQIEAQLLRTQRMQSIGALAGGIAHDLNNVLAPIMMAAQLLKDDSAGEENRRMWETVKASAQRGSEMVKQILTFARGVGGGSKKLQVKTLVTEMLKLAQDTFPRSIRIQSNVAGRLDPIQGDATQIHQVLLNLCVNARDAMPNGGTLRIDAENVVLNKKLIPMIPGPVSGRFVVVTVEDTGCGIRPEFLNKIYEPFFTTKEPGKGTGLGLSTVLTIVKAHEGFLEVASEVNKGTTFRVYLPAAVTADTAFVKTGLPAVQMGRGETVLLADDEVALLEITKSTLEAFNYQVATARNGAEALALYRQRSREISVVVTDLMMPVMDGAALIKELRKIEPQVKIICVSGLGSKAKLPDITQLNPHAYLAKPYSTEKLLTTVFDTIIGT